jgi:hypothetical protein
VIGVGAAASVQFGGRRSVRLRVVAVDSRPTYHGYAWITGYVLDRDGLAVEKRDVFVQLAGLVLMRAARRPVRRLR